ncbi:C2 calcium-dependent domain-containing protein 4A [Phodopus roborovskii]|uniref:C2cd4a protein n=1 Tax=Phodopus roborovskii TaxID=109678 RepID=A0AAU9ZW29_PHORO|nr:C2 calcium-dependent domain-containing protein 4A [Phodopus roborovskii]CAH6874106.1 C2cd4a [Phodopus roborovskii]
MWCLQQLLRNRDGFLPGRARRSKARSSPECVNVLTPDRIPEFCIPPKLEPSTTWAALRDAWAADAENDDHTGRTDWDPRSQAALSLRHLPRARTAYGFCALLQSPHTRRKESLFLGHPGARVLVPGLHHRSYTYGSQHRVPDSSRSLPRNPNAAAVPQPTPVPRRRRFLRAPDGLLSRALRIPRGRARACSWSSRDKHERAASCASPAPASPRPELLQAEASVALSRGDCTLRLAAEYCPRSACLRLRLLRAEGPAAALEPRALGCRLSLVLWHSGQQRSSVLRRSRKAALDQDCCFDGLSEEQLRRLSVRIKAESKGRGLVRGRPLGQGELLLGSLLLL